MAEAYEKFVREILIDEARLQARIGELGQQISEDYATCSDLLLICVLKGGVMFLTDLTRRIRVPHEIDFMAVSSYGRGVRESGGKVRIDMDLSAAVEGRNLLIVEDIIDSGNTLAFLLNMLQARQPASVRLCTLLNKASRRQTHVPIHYVGFEIEDKFVFGYGLDLDEKFRNLPFVAVANTDALTPPR